MTTPGTRDDARLSIVAAPAAPRDRRLPLAFSIAVAIAFIAIAPYALAPLPRTDGFIPAVQAIIAAADFITAVLLFAHYAADRSPALRWLASGYLFGAVIVVAQMLTFPGAFTATGLLGAGPQTAAWLYLPWHVAVPAAAIAYALVKRRPGVDVTHRAAVAVIRRTALVTIAAAVVVIAAVIVARDALPVLVVSETGFSAMASVVTVVPLVASVVAFILLWRRRTSVLDEWLMVALSASLAETALIVFIGASRYTVAFYASRLFAVIVASAVLVALLTDMTKLYVRLSIAVKALQRERATKLMSLDVVVGSIGHELRQPLTVIQACCMMIDDELRQPSIPVDDVRVNLADMTKASARITETIESLRSLFKHSQEVQQPVDVNALALEALQTLGAELSSQRILVTSAFAADLPRVVGHTGQLRELFINIVQNAIDAMAPLTDRPRTLRVGTSGDRDSVTVSIQDSGPGIAPERLPNLFTAFISTKTSGMGLGLGICQMIVERHNGRLSVSSDLGQGTRFDVVLPAEPPA